MRPSLGLTLALLSLALPAGASAHGRVSAVEEERLVREFEEQVLGPTHAAQHAEQRRGARSDVRPSRTALERTARVAALAVDGTKDQIGHWNPPFDLKIFAINTIALPTGKVLMFAYPNHPLGTGGPRDHAKAWLWDPAKTGDAAWNPVDPPVNPDTGRPYNIWCAGANLLADGRVLVTGGNLWYPETAPDQDFQFYAGLKDVFTFDPWTETWTKHEDMAEGRWYPSQQLLPDGRVLIMGGLDERGHGDKNEHLEIFDPKAPLGQEITKVYGDLDSSPSPSPDESVENPPIGDYYPHLHWLADGRMAVAGPYTNDSWLMTRFDGAPAPPAWWEDFSNWTRGRVWGTGVLMPAGPEGSSTVMQIGGSDFINNDTNERSVPSIEVHDFANNDREFLGNTGAATQPNVHEPDPQEGSLHVNRAHHNTVLLPDGTMVTVGGGNGITPDDRSDGSYTNQWSADEAQKQVELWSPPKPGDAKPYGTWRLGAAQAEFRAYHSTAVLLPDGRVFSGGDDYNGGDADPTEADNGELYSPPYLFNGDAAAPRPVITGAPDAIRWGESFDLDTTGGATSAVLVAPGAATHAVDMSQRYVPLSLVSGGADALVARAPANPDIALPGHYMLFVLDAAGTPSSARWIWVGDELCGNGEPPRGGCSVGPQPTITPAPTVTPQPVTRPTLRAKLIRRGKRRRVRLFVGPADVATIRVRVRLLDRRGRLRKKARRTVATGRRTTLRKLRVPRAARKVRVKQLASAS